jgi:hypothetical protein
MGSPRRVVGQVLAAHDVGDALLGVVDDDGELVGPQAVGALQHEVADVGFEILGLRAQAPVLPGHAAVDAKAPGAHGPAMGAEAAGARVDEFAMPGPRPCGGSDLGARASAAIGVAAGNQAVQRGLVEVATAGLPDGRLVRHEAQRRELAEDDLVHARRAARAVDVLDAHQPLAAVGAGVQPAG